MKTNRKRRGNSVDEAFEELHDRIISGVYAPGRKLSQMELAEQLNISRTPLREVLNRLQANGLVVATNNRGMEVSAVSHEKTEQGYAMRLLLEPPIVAALAEDLTSTDLEKMQEALEDMERFEDRTKDYQDAHHRFHLVMLSYYPDDIREMVERIYTQILRHQSVYFSRPRVPFEIIETDRMFLQALIDHDGELARQLLEFHLLDAALGLALDYDPDYVPEWLIKIARGAGIVIAFDEASGRIERPARISWSKGSSMRMPSLSTTNLEYIKPE